MHKPITPTILQLALLVALIFAGNAAQAAGPETGETVTVFDHAGTRVQVTTPVERVISVNSGMTALICALGAGDKLIGRDSFSTFPTYAREHVEVVAESSANCNLELLISKAPDLIMADTMFYPQYREKLDAAGIPSYVDSTSDPERLLTLIRSAGLVLDANDKADELADFVSRYADLVDTRIARLDWKGGYKPRVYFEWHSDYETANAETSFHKPIAEAGGINIAAGLPVRTPVMSSEWIIQQNPEVIVNRISGDATLAQMEKAYEDIVHRAGWDQIDAVKNNRVHIVKSDVFLTFRYPVGLLYYAKWFHPDLFADVDPEAVHREAIETFFGPDEWDMVARHETFVYPLAE